MPVYFCIVAVNQHDADEIFNVASAAAADNLAGRKVLRAHDANYPGDAVIDNACAGVDPRGAVILKNDLTVFDALNVDDAKNGAIVEDVFAQAAAGA